MEPPADDGAVADPRPTPLSPAGAVALILAVPAFALLTWQLPLLAIATVWPILFFVPGWVVIRRIVPDLPVPGVIGAAIVTSVYVSSHLVNVVARVTGFGPESVIVSAVILAFASVVVEQIHHRWLTPIPRPTGAGIVAALRADAPAWIIATATGLAVFVVLMGNGWHETANGWVSGGWNWSDLLVHVAIGSSIAAGNFPPEVPYFAGVPLTYHWFADFQGAITSTRRGRRPHPDLLRDQRPLRRRPRPRDVGARRSDSPARARSPRSRPSSSASAAGSAGSD